jgi:hypothetical protein
MNSSKFINFIQYPETILKEHLKELDELCEEYPYCSSLHKIRLKCLQGCSIDRYNNALKLAAIISGNRSKLFDFIKDDSFGPIKKNILIPKKKSNESLSVRPIDLNNTGMHSFSEWLKLSTLKPVVRVEKREKNSLAYNTDKIIDLVGHINKNKIDKRELFSPIQRAEESLIENNHLMTETLANLYVEQGHHQKAIIAFEILSLKYPQKSSLFAGRIKDIKFLNS